MKRKQRARTRIQLSLPGHVWRGRAGMFQVEHTGIQVSRSDDVEGLRGLPPNKARQMLQGGCFFLRASKPQKRKG